MQTLQLVRAAGVGKIATAIGCSILTLSLSLYIIPDAWAIQLVKYFGIWGILITFCLFLFALRRPLTQWIQRGAFKGGWAQLPALLTILAATLYLHLHVDRGFKILYDEHAISSTAMSIYFEQQAYVQTAAHILDGATINSVGFVDKRPIFFPFLLSLVHLLSGFRPQNVFWLNSALSGLLLCLLYAIAHTACGRRGGILAVLLLTGLPLLAQNATGGGYEVLNLCLIAALLLTAFRYMQGRGSHGLNLMILTAILLANNRYESVLYVSVPMVLLLLKSWREKRIALTWFSACSPLLLTLPLLSFAVFQADTRFFQTSKENFLGAEHLPANLEHAGAYLFDWSGDYSNSVLLSSGGILCLLALLCIAARQLPQLLKKDTHLTVSLTVFVVVAVNTGLALCSFWGQWTDPTTARFSFPLQLFMALAVPFVLQYGLALKQPPRWVMVLSAAFIPLVCSPHSMRLNQEVRLPNASASQWAIDWVGSHGDKSNHFIIADACIGLVLHRHAAAPIAYANQYAAQIKNIQRLQLYENIFVVEMFHHNRNGPQARASEIGGHAIAPCFQLQAVADFQVDSYTSVQISRVRASADLAAHIPDPQSPRPPAVAHEYSKPELQELLRIIPSRE
jgi:hypothetical protein